MALLVLTGHAIEALPGAENMVVNIIKSIIYKFTRGLYFSLAQQLQYYRYEMPNEAFND
jgi:hypothetical protein